MIIEVKRPRITNYHKNWDGEGSTPYQQMYSYCSQKKSQLGVLVMVYQHRSFMIFHIMRIS